MIRLAALLTLLAGPAAAHGAFPGGGGFAGGFLHPFVATEQLLLLLALGGLIGRQAIRRPVLGLLAGLGLGFGLASLQQIALQPVILAMSFAMGASLAANLRLSGWVVTGLALLAGLAMGMDTDVTVAVDATALMARGGVVAGVLVIVLNVMAIAQYAGARLNGVPLRVAGSWLAAAAMLMLAFLLRGAWSIT